MIHLEVDMTEINDALNRYSKFITQDLVDDIGNECVNYFKDSFRRQSWNNIPWKSAYGKTKGILIDSGTLRNSIKVSRVNKMNLDIISDAIYSKLHNEGGRMIVSDKMRRAFWAKYNRTKMDKFKAMALSKTITIPQRQFMGFNKELQNNINDLIEDRFKKIR